jgi:hypothetical protein
VEIVDVLDEKAKVDPLAHLEFVMTGAATESCFDRTILFWFLDEVLPFRVIFS